MTKKDAISELVSIGASLARGSNLPSSYVDDYKQKRYSPSAVAAMMREPHESQKVFAVRIRRCIDVLMASEARDKASGKEATDE